MERRDGQRTSELDLLDELTLERNAAEEQHCQAFQVRVAAEEAAQAVEQKKVFYINDINIMYALSNSTNAVNIKMIRKSSGGIKIACQCLQQLGRS